MSNKRNAPANAHEDAGIGESQRDYPHGSGDRNTKKSESDWKKSRVASSATRLLRRRPTQAERNRVSRRVDPRRSVSSR